MRTEDFDYELPEELIAQEPAYPRDSCRMLVLDRASGVVQHRVFSDIIEYLDPGDLLVANETRVMPARLLGNKAGTGGAAEVLLLRQRQPQEFAANSEEPVDRGDGAVSAIAGKRGNALDAHVADRIDTVLGASQAGLLSSDAFARGTAALWEGLVKPGRRLKPGTTILFGTMESPVLQVKVLDWAGEAASGERLLLVEALDGTVQEALAHIGLTPLPPYITQYHGDREMYQTVYARTARSAAAPTAGLHFTEDLLGRIRAKGVGFATVDLEVGLDTFRIVAEDEAEDHAMHTERYTVSAETIEAIERTKCAGGRVIAVGTTSTRSLESAWDVQAGRLVPREREATSLYILPGYHFHVVDALVTNFHTPRSTLMMLVSALASREQIMAAYAQAIQERYRMLSFGDAMFIK